MKALQDYYDSLRASAAQAQDFDEVRRLRALTQQLEEQRLLALEDRRAYARELVQTNPLTGSLSMAILAPAEQAYKGVNSLMGRQIGRSGYFAPLANIGATYQGVLEGLATRK